MCRASQDPDAQGGPEYEYEQHLAQMERDEQDQDGADDYQERQGEGMREMQMEEAAHRPQYERGREEWMWAGWVRLTPRPSSVPARVTTVLARSGITLAEAQRMDDDELMGIPWIGPVSFRYIRSTRVPPEDASTKAASFVARAWASLWKAGKP